ncbi:MAG: hypothetical protein DRJ69_02795 [Thermoprotei archaeon]|nr:MAG: hypothetical protein DRJ69_02795 [Thermoprotei archaeon]
MSTPELLSDLSVRGAAPLSSPRSPATFLHLNLQAVLEVKRLASSLRLPGSLIDDALAILRRAKWERRPLRLGPRRC